MNSKIILIAFNLCLIGFWGCADDNETNIDSVFNGCLEEIDGF